MSQVAFTEIHHLAIIASDLVATKQFYVELLGLPLIREHYRPTREDYKLDLQMGPQELEIFVVKNPPKRPSFPEAAGLRHLAFKVPVIEDTIAYLKQHDVLCEPIRIDDYTGKKMTFFFDPDGLPLELHE
jgi:glyoxylase I family protein